MTQPRYAVPVFIMIAAAMFIAGFLLRPLSAEDAQKKTPAADVAQKAAPAAPAVTKWEYKVVSDLDTVSMESQLNGWGAMGWECVGTISEMNNQIGITRACIIFKRPKQ